MQQMKTVCLCKNQKHSLTLTYYLYGRGIKTMNQTLRCDIDLGGSTEQFLDYGLRNYNEQQFIDSINRALYYRAKTKPKKLAQRFGCLLSIAHTKYDNNDYLLDCIIAAFHKGA